MSRYDIDKQPQSLAELEPLILAAQAELSTICNGKRFRMSIPVDDADSDMVIGDALRHSLAFVRAALPPSSPVADSPTWQPIETVPEDAENIIAAWRDGEKCETGEVLRMAPRWLCLLTDCFVFPTHWMPLPSAPSPSAGAAKDKE